MRLVLPLAAALVIAIGLSAACGDSSDDGGGSGGNAGDAATEGGKVGGAGGDSATPTGGTSGDATVVGGTGGVGGTVDAGIDACACASGQTCCGGGCVSDSDPTYGCGASSCAPCALANATATCEPGGCAISACDAGFADCNGSGADGCETDTSASVNDCGGCGVVCAPIQATAACVNGSCALT